MPAVLQPAPKNVRLSRINPASTGRIADHDEIAQRSERIMKRLYDLHYLMYAENKRALVIILQGIDASGKDGLVHHIAGGLNPQGTKVYSFKQPSEEELDHDYLWRVHRAMPGRGEIAIFNRSHYEEVTAVKVHPELLLRQNLPDELLKQKRLFRQRYRQINQFERMLAENGTVVVKFLLHISSDEQEQRLEERLRDPRKHWKFSRQDLVERRYWNDYMGAFEQMVEATNTSWAPWYIIPADVKWFRNYAALDTVVRTLEKLNMAFPSLPG